MVVHCCIVKFTSFHRHGRRCYEYSFACVKRNKIDSELLTCLLKLIEYFPDYLSALSRTLLRFFGTTFVETAVCHSTENELTNYKISSSKCTDTSRRLVFKVSECKKFGSQIAKDGYFMKRMSACSALISLSFLHVSMAGRLVLDLIFCPAFLFCLYLSQQHQTRRRHSVSGHTPNTFVRHQRTGAARGKRRAKQ